MALIFKESKKGLKVKNINGSLAKTITGLFVLFAKSFKEQIESRLDVLTGVVKNQATARALWALANSTPGHIGLQGSQSPVTEFI